MAILSMLAALLNFIILCLALLSVIMLNVVAPEKNILTIKPDGRTLFLIVRAHKWPNFSWKREVYKRRRIQSTLSI